MELKSFKEKSKRNKNIVLVSIGLVLFVTGIILYQTFALFEESEEYDVIKGNVPDYINNYDVKVKFTLDGKVINTVPERESGIGIDDIVCDDATGVWNYKEWNFGVKDLSHTKTTCTVNFVTKYTEPILNGTDPVIKEGLIPVNIDSNGNVTKANVQEKWYEYENQVWANAVILKEESINYQDGEQIPEENIESYFVWIPRYRYKIFNEGIYEGLQSEVENRVQTIEIEFEDKAQKIYQGRQSGEWLTHPAFTSFDVNGMWVGKFETGYKEAKSIEEAQVNANEPQSIEIKPNVYSWRGINVANAFYSSYNYKREMDSHMMKNTEWGAVAYLSHSKYGSQDSVRINNNESYVTGYAAVKEPTCGYTVDSRDCNIHGKDDLNIMQLWNTEIGVLASTTGNISGIYDMSGGSWEYVMGVMLDSTNTLPCTGTDASNTSGFSGEYCKTGGTMNGLLWPEAKYYDRYAYNNSIAAAFNERILGDATGEFGPFGVVSYVLGQPRQVGAWYDDDGYFVFSGGPWFIRGGACIHGIGSGVFNFSATSGSIGTSFSFRVVLSF